MTQSIRIAMFFDGQEALVGPVLDPLDDVGRLPACCIVVDSDRPLWGALCTQWEGRVDLKLACIRARARRWGTRDAAALSGEGL